MESDWNDHAVNQEVARNDRNVASRMDPPQRPVVPMPEQVVDFPLADQEEDDDVTVVGSDDEQEAAAQSTLEEGVPRQDESEIEEVPRQNEPEIEEVPRQDMPGIREIPRKDGPVIAEVVSYNPNAPAFEIITIED